MANNPRQRWSARVNKKFPARARDDGGASRQQQQLLPKWRWVHRRNNVPPPSALQATNYRRIDNDEFNSPHRQARREEEDENSIRTHDSTTTTTKMGPYTCPLFANSTKDHPMVKGSNPTTPPKKGQSQKGEETSTGPATVMIGEDSAGGYPGKGTLIGFKGWMNWGNAWKDGVDIFGFDLELVYLRLAFKTAAAFQSFWDKDWNGKLDWK